MNSPEVRRWYIRGRKPCGVMSSRIHATAPMSARRGCPYARRDYGECWRRAIEAGVWFSPFGAPGRKVGVALALAREIGGESQHAPQDRLIAGRKARPTWEIRAGNSPIHPRKALQRLANSVEPAANWRESMSGITSETAWQGEGAMLIQRFGVQSPQTP